jgi:DNA-binding LacI/PurR family transcriptional regulator
MWNIRSERAMTPPAKRPTSSDVARAAGVSQTTVSFVLNNRPHQSIPEETRQRVLDAVRKLNYRPHASARALAAGRSDVVLLSIPQLPIGQGISRFVEELAAALAEHGLTLVTHLTGEHGRPLPEVCAAISASAVIGFGAFTSEMTEALRRAGADVVIPSHPNADVSMAAVGRLQAEHLIDRGKQHLGFAVPAHPGLLAMAKERLKGVAKACADAGITPPVAVTTGLNVESASAGVAELAHAGVDGVCAFNDETAIAVLAGMQEQGLSAPGDMAVIGVDDIPTARLSDPPLTSAEYDLQAAARLRAEAIVAALAGDTPDRGPHFLNPRIVQRAST